MRPDVLLKIKEEVKKQFDAGFLQVVKYSEWVANIVPVLKKDGKVQMCVDYRNLNKACPKDNFSLPHIDTLVDNTAGYSLFSFMDGFSGYNQIKMHPEDMEKTTFITMWGTFCYKVMPFGLKNARATYQRTMCPVSMPPCPDKPLILYLTVFENSMGCVLGQHDESGRKEKAIYYLSKKFTEYPLKYVMESNALNGRMARWQILLSEFDIVYVNQKAVKGSAIADFLASRALEDYELLSFDFPNEDLMYVATTEEDSQEGHCGNRILTSFKCQWSNGIRRSLYPQTEIIILSPKKLDFDCTNNMANLKHVS
ncbi:uncharacterized protein LOC128283844 [Gossypium arboreum]|uniref:uncharacterized protein LOC128283844 n=1 Tax=Gossypium arboreum TaxID=29729 RepID=UPI0022F1692F|nr:uncharacterized protein LOC128283844 [Gossypium arboreum]